MKDAKSKALKRKMEGNKKESKPSWYAEEYKVGEKPSKNSEYFGKSYKQLKHEAKHAND